MIDLYTTNYRLYPYHIINIVNHLYTCVLLFVTHLTATRLQTSVRTNETEWVRPPTLSLSTKPLAYCLVFNLTVSGGTMIDEADNSASGHYTLRFLCCYF